MILDDIAHLASLAAVAIVAIGGVLLLLRLGGRQAPPAERELLALPALADLAAAQGRLLALQRALPPQSEEAVWLGTFLRELRPVMDTAYRVAMATRAYGSPAGLDALSAEVLRIEAEVAAQIARRLLGRVTDTDNDLLDARLAALRLCARELAAS
jgi:hypothetical protein